MSEGLFPYKLPVRATKDCEIVSADGKVICPTLLYRGDTGHVELQENACRMIAESVNFMYGSGADIEAPKKRGRPAKVR